jgi:hypothetical protein
VSCRKFWIGCCATFSWVHQDPTYRYQVYISIAGDIVPRGPPPPRPESPHPLPERTATATYRWPGRRAGSPHQLRTPAHRPARSTGDGLRAQAGTPCHTSTEPMRVTACTAHSSEPASHRVLIARQPQTRTCRGAKHATQPCTHPGPRSAEARPGSKCWIWDRTALR